MEKTILNQDEIERKIFRIASEIAERNLGVDALVLIGIVRRGVPLAERLAAEILEISGVRAEVGSLDITLYGADHNLLAKYPILNGTSIDFPIDNKTVILVDDILYTGKTIHTAIDALLEIGSPSDIQLAAFIDRGRRTFPISADYVGIRVPSSGLERVALRIEEVDGETCAKIITRDSLEERA